MTARDEWPILSRRAQRLRRRALRERARLLRAREEGRRLASERDDLIAQGVDPADLAIPLYPDDPGGGQ